jgi:hypothetical protein
MSHQIRLTSVNPSAQFTAEDAVAHWTLRQGPTQYRLRAEVPHHPPDENPEWTPHNPQEVPLRTSRLMADWSPSSTAAPAIIEDEQDTTKHDSPARPDGKHDLGDTPDERTGPVMEEDPRSQGAPAEDPVIERFEDDGGPTSAGDAGPETGTQNP